MKSNIHHLSEIHSTTWINPINVIIKKDVKIGPLCCIGSSGLNVHYRFYKFGRPKIIESLGKIIIEENVEMTCMDIINLALKEDDSTIIKKNVKIGPNNVIGHDCVIDEGTIITGSVQINGHVKIGKNCFIGAGSVIRNRVEIGDNAFVSMGAIVTKNVRAGEHVSGNFAIDHKKFIDYIKKISE